MPFTPPTEPPTPAMVDTEFVNVQKQRTGLDRVIGATAISAKGLRAASTETAFRQELLAACVLVPASFLIGGTWVETVLLVACVFLVLVVEVLNSAIEAVVDRIGLEYHPLSGAAKDMGSAAVALSLVLCAGVWATAIWRYFD